MKIKKILNKLIVISQYKLFKNSYVIGFPYKLTIDPCSICNLKCPLCPTGKEIKGRKKGKMSFSDFKKIVDEVKDYIYYIDLFQWGEPLLNEDVLKMIDYATKNDIRVLISTNLNNLNDKTAENIVKSNLSELIVSLDGASQKTVEKYQIGNNFDQVINNIKLVIKKKKELGKNKPTIRWRFLVMKHNEHEINKAKELVKELGIDKLELGTFRWDTHMELFKDNKTQYRDAKPWLPLNEKYSLYNYKDENKKRILKNDCSWLWTHMVINCDGSVSPCCFVYYDKYDFGNVLKTSVKGVWNNKYYRASRKKIATGKDQQLKTICDICYKNKAMT